jgi:serine/threonine protein phosphatase PrpC
MNIKVLQLHKRASYEYKYIQDKFEISLNNRCIALSDGTTQSFKSEIWAKMIVDEFVKKPTFIVEDLITRLKESAINFKNNDFVYSLNFAKAALEKDKQKKGGTATFIGLQFVNDSTIKILNCGDSCLFILRKDKILPFPFKNLDELDNNNFFINSSSLIDSETEADFFNYDEITLEKDDKLILATDAISRLIFSNPEIISTLLSINSFEELKDFCQEYWKKSKLEEDDISIIIVSPLLPSEIIEIVPPTDFSFPKEVEKIFVPSVKTPNFINDLDPVKMEQLNKMIQQLFRETNFLKEKLKLTQVLLISSLLLLALNTALLFYSLRNKEDGKSTIEKTINIPTETKTQRRDVKKVTLAPKVKDISNSSSRSNEDVRTATKGDLNPNPSNAKTQTVEIAKQTEKAATVSTPEDLDKKVVAAEK